MAKYKITTEQGSYLITTDEPNQSGIVKKSWDALAVPEQLSREGLQQLAGYVPSSEPTGNLVRDVALNTPKIAADTLAQVAPSFVSRGSILTAGAMQAAKPIVPLLATAGQGVANQLEEMSGIAPKAKGALTSAFNDATAFFAKGKKAAQPLYQAAQEELPQGSSLFKGMWKPEQIVDTAQDYLSKGGNLEPAEALTYRKAIDSLMKSGRYVKDELMSMRGEADAMAKASENIAQADPMFVRGIQAEAMRNVFPQNKLGGASPFKMLVGKGIGGAVSIPFLSPFAQGLGSTGLGLLYRGAQNPAVAASLPALMGLGLRKSVPNE